MNTSTLQRSQLLIAILATVAISGCSSNKSNSSSKPSNDNTASVPTCTAEQYLNTDKTECTDKATQTLTGFSLPTDLIVGDTASLSATASSGSAVTYSTSTPDVCTVSGDTVTAVSAGECTITATQAGDETTLAVSNTASTTIAEATATCTSTEYLNPSSNTCVAKASQTISDLALDDLIVGETMTLSATASSGSAVTYTSDTPDVCTVADSKVTAVSAGECTITASQAGDEKTLAVSETVTTSITAPDVATSKLTKTGITECGDYAYDGGSSKHSNDLDCSLNVDSEGDPIPAGQDGHVQAGLPLSYAIRPKNGSKCIIDKSTGLTWEQKTNDGGLRDRDNTYTWYNPDASTNGGSAGTQNGGTCTGSDCDTHAYIQALNNANYCGYSDWRMPTRSELVSIVDYGRYNPAINPIFTNTQSSGYWSASPFASPSSGAWGVNFYDGSAGNDFKHGYFHVRAVRSSQ